MSRSHCLPDASVYKPKLTMNCVDTRPMRVNTSTKTLMNQFTITVLQQYIDNNTHFLSWSWMQPPSWSFLAAVQCSYRNSWQVSDEGRMYLCIQECAGALLLQVHIFNSTFNLWLSNHPRWSLPLNGTMNPALVCSIPRPSAAPLSRQHTWPLNPAN